MVVVTVINAGPALFLECGFPTVATFIQPFVHALTHVDTVICTGGHGKQDEERAHGQHPLSRYRSVNLCFAAFDASLADDLGALGHLVPASQPLHRIRGRAVELGWCGHHR